jgi:hypothetical protein
MSTPFEIATKAAGLMPSPTQRTGPKLKPLAERKSLHALRLRNHDEGIVGKSADALLEQFYLGAKDAEVDSDGEKNETRKRSHTREQKVAAVLYATTKRVPGKGGRDEDISNRAAAAALGIEPVQLRIWKRTIDQIRDQPKGSRRNKKSHPCAFPEMEREVTRLFGEKRGLGRRIGDKWLQRQARLTFEELYPHKVTIVNGKKEFNGMQFSEGWFNAFKKRNNISLREPTKKAQVVPEDFKPQIVNWLQFNRRAQAKYGFELSEIANMDQTPLQFEFLSSKTYAFKGEKTVFVKSARSGWDKRQCTLQILVHADGKPRCKPLLIFHGASDKRQHPKWPALKKEYKLYDKRVAVMFNPKAWSNTDLMVEWIRHHYIPSTNYPFFQRNSTQRPPRFLSLDVFSGQKTQEVTDSFKSIKCTTSFIPSGTTGFIQVCDTTVNHALKSRIEELADIYIDQNEREWVEGKYSISDRRVLLTKWVGQAWQDMHQEDSDMIRGAFEKVGLGLPIDGSQDHKISIKDFPGVKVGDWKSWKPANEEDNGELQSNLTSTEVEKLAITLNPCDDSEEYNEDDTIVVEGM